MKIGDLVRVLRLDNVSEGDKDWVAEKLAAGPTYGVIRDTYDCFDWVIHWFGDDHTGDPTWGVDCGDIAPVEEDDVVPPEVWAELAKLKLAGKL